MRYPACSAERWPVCRTARFEPGGRGGFAFQKLALGPPNGFSKRRTWFVRAATETANLRSLHLLVLTCTRALLDKLVTNTSEEALALRPFPPHPSGLVRFAVPSDRCAIRPVLPNASLHAEQRDFSHSRELFPPPCACLRG